MADPFRSTRIGKVPAGALRGLTWNERAGYRSESHDRRRARGGAVDRWLAGRRALFEPLEPRYLLSADLMPFTLDMADPGLGDDLTLRLDSMTNHLQVVDNRQVDDRPVIAQRALDQTTSVRVMGTASDDRLTLDFAAPFALPFGISFSAGAGSDSLRIHNGLFDKVAYQAQGRGAGVIEQLAGLTGQSITYDGLEALADGSPAGAREVANNTGASQEIRLGDDGDPTNGELTIEVTGAPATTFASPADSLKIQAGDAGDTIRFEGLDGAFTGTLSMLGGAGSDTVVAGNGANIWTITGADAGTLNGHGFAGIENLTGGAGDDRFVFLPGGSVSGMIDGGGGLDTLDYGAQTAGVSVDLARGAASLTGAVRAIDDVTGGAGDDVLSGDAGANLLLAGAGDDLLSGGGGADRFDGGAGSDTLAGPDDANTWLITGLGSGLLDGQGFAAIENLTGGASDDSYGFASVGSLGGQIDGGAGTNTLDYGATTVAVLVNLAAGMASRTSSVRNIRNVIGGAGADRLTGDSGINHLRGGAGDDTLAGGLGTDAFDGGLGTDTLLGEDTATTWAVTGLNAGTRNGENFVDVENLTGGALGDSFVLAGGSLSGSIAGGGGADTLTGGDAANTWTITSADAGGVTGVAGGFGGIEHLTGGALGDSFTLAGGTLSGSIAGGGGVDTLTGGDAANSWTITSADAGALSGVAGGFSGVENLVGGALGDSFTLAGGSLSGSIAGGGGADTLAGDNLANSWTVTSADTGTLTGLAGGFSGIESLVGGVLGDSFTLAGGSLSGSIAGGGGTDTLTGGDAANSWTVTSADAGSVTGVAGGFGGVEHLVGGALGDSFVFAGGSLSGSIAGGGGADTLTGDNVANNWTVTSADAGGVTAVAGGFSGVEHLVGGALGDSFTLAGGSLSGSIAGGGGGDTLQGGDGANSWAVTGTDSGTVTGVAGGFSAIGTLVGGSGQDTFGFGDGTGVSGTIDGGAGLNSLDYAAATTGVSVNLSSGAATGTAGVSKIQNLTGGSGDDAFILDLGMAFPGGGVIGLHGGGQIGAGADSLTINGSLASASVAFNGADLDGSSGTATLDGNSVQFTGLGLLTITGPAADLLVQLTEGPDADATLRSAASLGRMELVGSTFDTLTFANPTGALTIDARGGDDRLTIESVDAGLSAPITLRGGAGADALTGGPGADILVGGDGDDTLAGGAGDDTYLFEDNWRTETLVEAADGGADLLDLTRISRDMTFTHHADGGLSITDGPNFVNRFLNIEDSIGGTTHVFEDLLTVSQTRALLDQVHLTGVSVVTHGLPPSGGAAAGDDLLPLARAIQDRAGGWLLDYDVPMPGARGGFDPGASLLPTLPVSPSAAGHLTLLFDWAVELEQASAAWIEAAGDALFSMLVGLGVVDPEARADNDTPLHFIGHGAGSGVVSEAVERLARYDVPVDQVTYLDPINLAPAAGQPPGGGVAVWDNVAFADAYYQTRDAGAAGSPIAGARNVWLNDELPDLATNPYLTGDISGDHDYVWQGFYLTSVAGGLSEDLNGDGVLEFREDLDRDGVIDLRPSPAAPVDYGQTGYGHSRIAIGLNSPAGLALFRPDPIFYNTSGLAAADPDKQDHAQSDAVLVDPLTGLPNEAGLLALGLTAAEVAQGRWAPEWYPLSIFNGGFESAGPFGAATLPGRAHYGGGGDGEIVSLASPISNFALAATTTTSTALQLGSGSSSFTLNSFMVSPFAIALSFDLKQLVADPEDKLQVRLGDEVIYRQPISTVDTAFRTVEARIPPELRGQNHTLTFEILADGLFNVVSAEVQIDNVEQVLGFEGKTGDVIAADFLAAIMGTTFGSLKFISVDGEAFSTPILINTSEIRSDQLPDQGSLHFQNFGELTTEASKFENSGVLHFAPEIFNAFGPGDLPPETNINPVTDPAPWGTLADQNGNEILDENNKPIRQTPKTRGFNGVLSGEITADGTVRQFTINVTAGFSTSGANIVTLGPAATDPVARVDVARAQQRLNYLGFPDSNGNLLVVDGQLGPKSNHSIGLFNVALNSADDGQRHHPHVASNRFSEPAMNFINDASAPRWMELQPVDGFFFRPTTFGTEPNQRVFEQVERWGTSWMQEVIEIAAANWLAASGTTDSMISAGDSLIQGGDTPFHNTHESGMDLDIETPSTNSTNVPFFAVITGENLGLAPGATLSGAKFVRGNVNGSIVFYDPIDDNYFTADPVLINNNSDFTNSANAVQLQIAGDTGNLRSAWDNRNVLEGIRDLIVSPAGYDLDVVKQQIRAFLSVNEVQNVTEGAAGGSFTLGFEGQATGAITVDAAAAAVQAALEGLSTIGAGNVTVTKAGAVYTVTFKGTLGNRNVAQLVATGDATIATAVDGSLGINETGSGTTIERVLYNDPRTWELGARFAVDHGGHFHLDIIAPENPTPIDPADAGSIRDGIQQLLDALGLLHAFEQLGELLPWANLSLGDTAEFHTSLQQIVLDPLADYLASTTSPTIDGMAAVIRDAGADFISGALSPDGAEIAFDLGYMLNLSKTLPVDLGEGGALFGVNFDLSATLELLTTLDLGLTFGVDITDPLAPAFFVRDASLVWNAEAAATDLNFGIDIGFLAARIGDGIADDDPASEVDEGSVRLNAGVRVALITGADGRLTLDEIAAGIADPASLFSVSPIANTFEAVLPVDVEVTGFNAATLASFSGAVLTIRSDDVFSGKLPSFSATGGVLDFGNIFNLEMFGLIERLADWVGSLTGSPVLDLEIPFLEDVTLGEAIDFARGFKEDFLDPLILRDAQNRPVFDSSGSQILSFGSVQEFASKLTTELGLPAANFVNYDPFSRDLTFDVDFGKSFTFLDRSLDLDIDLGGFANFESSSTLTLTAAVNLAMTFGLNLRPTQAISVSPPVFQPILARREVAAGIAFNAAAAELQLNLETLPGIDVGNVAVTKAGNVFTIEFINELGGRNIDQLFADGAGLTGGGVTVATLREGATGLNEIQSVTVGATGGSFALEFQRPNALLRGQLSGPANFDLALFEQDGSLAASFTVTVASDPTNTAFSINDPTTVEILTEPAETLVGDVQAAIDAQLVANGLGAGAILAEFTGTRVALSAPAIVVTDADGLPTRQDRSLEINTTFADPAFQELGLLSSPAPFDGNITSAINFTLEVDGVGYDITVPAFDYGSIDNLIDRINQAIDAAITAPVDNAGNSVATPLAAGDVAAGRITEGGNRLAFTAKAGSGIITLKLLGSDDPLDGSRVHLGIDPDIQVTERARATGLFLDNTVFSGSAELAVTGLTGSATLGFLGVEVFDSDGSISGNVSLELRDPETHGTRVFLDTLLDEVAQAKFLHTTGEALFDSAGNPRLHAAGDPILDSRGIAILDAAGNPLVHQAGDPVTDGSKGSPVLDIDGNPLLHAAGDPVLDTKGLAILDQLGNPRLHTAGDPVLGGYSGLLQADISGLIDVDLSIRPTLFGQIAAPATTFELDLDIVDWLNNPPALDNILDPDAIKTKLGALADQLYQQFQDITFDDVLAGLRDAIDYLRQLDGSGAVPAVAAVLDFELPLINRSIADLLVVADDFSTLVGELESNPAQSVQALETLIEEQLGLTPGSDLVSLNVVTVGGIPALRVDLNFADAFEDSVAFEVDLPGLAALAGIQSPFPETFSDLIGVSSSGNLNLELDGSLNLALGIELDGSPTPFLFTGATNGTRLKLSAAALGSDLNFTAQVGPFGIFVRDGSAELSGAVDISLIDTPDNRRNFGDLSFGDISLTTTGTARADLPVFFPTASQPVGGFGQNLLSFNIADLSQFFDKAIGSVTIVSPDFTDVNIFPEVPSLFDLITSPEVLVDGLDTALLTIQEAFDAVVMAVPLPVIGDGLEAAAQFIAGIRTDLLGPLSIKLRDTLDPVNLVQQTLFDVFASEAQGASKLFGEFGALGLLKDSTGDGLVTLDDITRSGAFATTPDPMNPDPDFGQFDFRIGQTFEFGQPINFDLGLPGLGLELDAGAGLVVDWMLDFGFGLDKTKGFYIETEVVDELALAVDAALRSQVGPARARLNINSDSPFVSIFSAPADGVLERDLTFELLFTNAAGAEGRRFSATLAQSATAANTSLAQLAGQLQSAINGAIAGSGVSLPAGLSVTVEVDAGGSKLTFSAVDANAGSDPLPPSGTLDIAFASGRGELAFLALDVVDDAANPTNLSLDFTVNIADPNAGNMTAQDDGLLTFSELLAPSSSFSKLVQAKVSGNAHIGLDANVNVSAFGLDGAVLPSILFDFEADWNFLEDDPEGGLAVFGSVPNVDFNDIRLDLGSFITDLAGPFLAEIDGTLDPLDWLIDPKDGLLFRRIPVISDLAGRRVTFTDLIELFDPDAQITPFLNAVEEVLGLIGQFSGAAAEAEAAGGNIVIPYGDLDIDALVAAATGAASDLRSLPGSLAGVLADLDDLDLLALLPDLSAPDFSTLESGAVKTFVTNITTGRGHFDFPLFEPANIFKLVLGQGDVTLVTYDAPSLSFDFFYRQVFPIIPPLFGEFSGRFGGGIELSLGYDTRGLEQFLQTDNALDLLNGLFISDVDLQTGVDVREGFLIGGISVGALLSLGFASVGARGGIDGTINFDLDDPDRDGKVRFGELAANLQANDFNPLAIFDVEGVFEWFFQAFFKIKLGFFSYTKTFDLGRGVIFDFDIEFERPPILAQKSGNELLLNIGRNAEARYHGDLRDIGESISVRQSGGDFLVSGFGVTNQRYSAAGIDRIVAFAGEGNDTVDLTGVLVETEIHGEAGADHLIGGAVTDRLLGGEGDDLIDGRGGSDSLAGGLGQDTLHGGLGNDLITGGRNRDLLFGGDGNDTLDGGQGDDALSGDLDDDTYVFGNDSDKDTVSDSGGANDTWDFSDARTDIRFTLLGPDNLDLFLQRRNLTTLPLGFPFGVSAEFLSNTVAEDQTRLYAVETILGGRGADVFDIFQTGVTGVSDGHGVTLNGQGGSDTYIVNFSDPNLPPPSPLDVTLRDVGDLWNRDRAIALGTDSPDVITVTEQVVTASFPGGQTQSFAYNKDPDAGIEFLEVRVFKADDRVTVESTPERMSVLVQGGEDDDTIVVGESTTLGVNEIKGEIVTGPLRIQGEGGNDTLIVDDSADTTDNRFVSALDDTSGLLTNKRVIGLGMTLLDENGERTRGAVEYEMIEALVVRLGSGNDEFTIEGTHAGTTAIDGGPGLDTVNVKAIAGPTSITGGLGDDTFNVGSTAPLFGGLVDQIGALLTLSGDADADTLNVDDSGDVTGDAGLLTGSTLTGLDFPSVNEIQTVTVDRSLASFALQFGLQATANFTLGASAAEVQTALEGLAGIGVGNVAVTKTDNVYTIRFQGELTGQDVAELIAIGGPGVAVATRNQGTASTALDDLQTVTVNATAGTFALTVRGETTAPIAYDASAIAVESALLTALRTALGEAFRSDVTVEKFGKVYHIAFRDDLGRLKGGPGVGLLVADTTLLTGGIEIANRMEGANYYALEVLNIDLGSGNDVFNVQGTSAVTNLDLRAGDDRVYVSSDSDLDLVTHAGFDFLTGDLDDLGGTLNIDAGTGRHQLMISDEAANAGDGNVAITDVLPNLPGLGLAATAEIWITGLATGGISYRADAGNANNFADGITVWSGSGADSFTVDGTHRRDGLRTVTTLNTGLGQDSVVVALDAATDGFFVLNTQGGDDNVATQASTLPLVIFGGLGDDSIVGGQGSDIVFGDRGRVHYLDELGAAAAVLGNGGPGDRTDGVIRDPGPIFTVDPTFGGADTIHGGLDDDIILGGTGNDRIDGQEDDDLILGDNGRLERRAPPSNPRFRALIGTQIYDGETGDVLIDRIAEFGNPARTPVWAALVARLDSELTAGSFGDDYIAGGAADDMIFGQLGDDVIQGDGSIDSLVDAGLAVGARRDPATGSLTITSSFEDVADGDDYIEGNGGADVIFGNLGQDDIIGGSSALFGLTTSAQRPDGTDLVFGGAGTRTERNDAGLATLDKHARDADTILGDNGNIFRLVDAYTGVFLAFNYDQSSAFEDRGTLRIVPRAAELIDYTAGGIDLDPAGQATDIGAPDELHGEAGDDVIYGMTGPDVIFGEGQDDDLIGGYGHDWISGGTGIDGVLGDDGRIFTSRNTERANTSDTALSELLYGIAKLETVGEEIDTPGDLQQAFIHPDGQLKKTADLTPFNLTPLGQADDPLFDPVDADDIVFGGLGDDFLHGGAGDDAILGAEALSLFYDNPTNPGDILGFGRDPNRVGEFLAYNEFDPLRRVRVGADGVFTEDGTGSEFLLNFDAAEGPVDPRGLKNSDGDDAIFGDLGNDWLVGGSGRDHIYGGFGDDLLNADDDHDTNGGLNDAPDTDSTYEDIAFGGAGRDVLIANTGGDRLIDWAGEFNSYLVPFAPFGAFTISRSLQPQLFEFLYDLSEADGADQTRFLDGGDIERNGEPFGEIGLVTQKDSFWRDQTGAPDDPQPGNIPGGRRDVLRAADFNDGINTAFVADSGTWTVDQGRLAVGPDASGDDAISVFYVDHMLPSYFEIQATISTAKPTAGTKANAYLIFDYQSPTDFKFAGVDVSLDKLQIGHRTAEGWFIQTPTQLKPETSYNVLLALHGTTATLVVNGTDVLSHTFAPRVIDGFSYGLNNGMVGVGAYNSVAYLDNVAVQVLPPEITFEDAEDFTDGVANLFAGQQAGTWQVAGNRYLGAPAAPEDRAVSILDPGAVLGMAGGEFRLEPASILEIETRLNTQTMGGVVFDYAGPGQFKFAAIRADTNQVVIGHHTERHGWSFDAVVVRVVDAGADYNLDVSLKGTTVSVSLDGQVVLGHAYNALVVDGRFGLLTGNGDSSFDTVTVRTNDPAFRVPESALLAAAAASDPTAVAVLDEAALKPILDEALRRASASTVLGAGSETLGRVTFEIADLPGLMLGRTLGERIQIDADAAGHGWFLDPTPDDEAEFRKRSNGDTIFAAKTSAAADRMDLLTVAMHELGHVVGLDHLTADGPGLALMADTLAAGVRHLPPDGTQRHETAAPRAFNEPTFRARVFDENRNILLSLEDARLLDMIDPDAVISDLDEDDDIILPGIQSLEEAFDALDRGVEQPEAVGNEGLDEDFPSLEALAQGPDAWRLGTGLTSGLSIDWQGKFLGFLPADN